HGLDVQIVVHPVWERGIGSSIAAGVAALQRRDERAHRRAGAGGCAADAVLITLADQPLVGPEALRRLLTARRDAGKAIAASRYAGTAGVPACFERALLPALLALDGATGCKPLLRAHADDTVLVDCPEAAQDVDTPADFARLLASPIHVAHTTTG
ncbi:NTP transferase domain-containing protein, partial [Candidatus Binatia bacterium]|nr:NTP transferase domain-containing protein [Candidatus Binatia bacterium]